MNSIRESIVEEVALDWLGGLGHEVLSGLTTIAPGETGADRADYKQGFLFDRLQSKLEELNPNIPLNGLNRASLAALLAGEVRVPKEGTSTDGHRLPRTDMDLHGMNEPEKVIPL